MKRETGKTHPGVVRIIGGDLKRSKLDVLDRPGLRPTPNRVRETVFNWLMPVIPNASVLDCFAGTGALGFEALSRGAAQAIFVEQDPDAAHMLRHNIARFGLEPRATVVQQDALRSDRQLIQNADLIFADPPFHHGISQAFLSWIRPELQPDSRLVIECARTETLQTEGFDVLKTLNAGMDRVYLLRVAA